MKAKIQKAVDFFVLNPHMTDRKYSSGHFIRGKYGKGVFKNFTPEQVLEAKSIAKDLIQNDQITGLQNKIAEQEKAIATYVGSKSTKEGQTKEFQSSRPLTPSEIEELAGVDGITSFVTGWWDKISPSGVWTYSINVRNIADKFYSKEELRARLKELFPTDIKPVKIPKDYAVKGKMLTIVLSDDHAGIINETNLYGNQRYTGDTYKERLMSVFSRVQDMRRFFEEVHIISLGDQLNGWNSQTTRGGHEVKSLKNGEQFDIYVSARKQFYEALFLSGMSTEYYVHDLENSNHSGKGFSYIANQYLDMYLEARFPEVKRKSYNEAIAEFTYGIHLVAMTHGKDETFMKKPFPLNIDAKTENFVINYVKSKGHSNKYVTFYKGDLHTLNINFPSFGRYVNCPAIVGNTDYSDINFSNTSPGALLEIYEENSKTITNIPIWF